MRASTSAWCRSERPGVRQHRAARRAPPDGHHASILPRSTRCGRGVRQPGLAPGTGRRRAARGVGRRAARRRRSSRRLGGPAPRPRGRACGVDPGPTVIVRGDLARSPRRTSIQGRVSTRCVGFLHDGATPARDPGRPRRDQATGVDGRVRLRHYPAVRAIGRRPDRRRRHVPGSARRRAGRAATGRRPEGRPGPAVVAAAASLVLRRTWAWAAFRIATRSPAGWPRVRAPSSGAQEWARRAEPPPLPAGSSACVAGASRASSWRRRRRALAPRPSMGSAPARRAATEDVEERLEAPLRVRTGPEAPANRSDDAPASTLRRHPRSTPTDTCGSTLSIRMELARVWRVRTGHRASRHRMVGDRPGHIDVRRAGRRRPTADRADPTTRSTSRRATTGSRRSLNRRVRETARRTTAIYASDGGALSCAIEGDQVHRSARARPAPQPRGRRRRSLAEPVKDQPVARPRSTTAIDSSSVNVTASSTSSAARPRPTSRSATCVGVVDAITTASERSIAPRGCHRRVRQSLLAHRRSSDAIGVVDETLAFERLRVSRFISKTSGRHPGGSGGDEPVGALGDVQERV